ncbi:MAG TPA: HAD-IA family hydrolase [bacterium]|nr:HAD-IA family hydrolase [bacterium]
MKKPVVRAVIFDFDGTLVSSTINFERMRYRIETLARSYGWKLPEKRWPAIETVQKLTSNQPEALASSFRRAAARLMEAEELLAASKARILSDSPAVLKKLRQAGLGIAIITRNCRRAVLPLLKKFRFDYDVVLTRDDVRRVKPHPEHLQKALSLLKVSPRETMVVGDHPFELKAGRKLRMFCVGVTTGGVPAPVLASAQPDFILKDVGQLPLLLGLEPFPPGKLPAEFLEGLLRRYIPASKTVLVGPAVGQDCALLRQRSGYLSVTSDPITLVGEDVGRYLVAVNANDLAVSGARPAWLLTTLVFPPGTTFPRVEEVFRQIYQECQRWHIAWAGGHTEFSPAVKELLATATMGGYPVGHRRKVKVRPGDGLLLVRPAGIEAASILARARPEELARHFSRTFLRRARKALKSPGISIVEEALWFRENFPVLAMHDPTEGGIATGIKELAQVCQVGFRIKSTKIKIYPPAKTLAEYFGLNPLGIISSGCLLVVLPGSQAETAVKKARKRKLWCALIGQAVPAEAGLVLEESGQAKALPYFPQDELARLT